MAVCSWKGREMHAGSRVGGGVEKKEEGTVEEGTEQNRGPPPPPHCYLLTLNS